MDRRGTEIAGRNVPVESGEIITIEFSGGPQPGDAGPKDFWVIFNERDAYIARWRHGEDPGERFRIMVGLQFRDQLAYCDARLGWGDKLALALTIDGQSIEQPLVHALGHLEIRRVR